MGSPWITARAERSPSPSGTCWTRSRSGDHDTPASGDPFPYLFGMKFKEIFFGLGLRPPAREYGFDIREYDVTGVGKLQFAQWRHPRAGEAVPSVDELNGLKRWLKPGDV